MDFLREVRRNRSLNNAAAAKAVHYKEVIAEARICQFDTAVTITVPLLLIVGYGALIRPILSPANSGILAGILLQLGPSTILLSSFLLSARLTSITRDTYILTFSLLFASPIWLTFAFFIGFCFAFPLPAGFLWGSFVGVAFGTQRSINVGLTIGIGTLILGMISAVFYSVFDDVFFSLVVMAVTMGALIPVGTAYLALAHRVARRPHDACKVCGYALIGLTTDRCPECGTHIAVHPLPTNPP